MKEEPLIPVGLGLTCYALYGATRSIRRGDKTQTNAYFRARVYAQSFTLLCLVVGSIYWKEDREKRKQFENLLSEKKAMEKRDAWIKELEARDREEEVEREKRRRRREAQALAKTEKKAATEAQDSDSSSNSSVDAADLRRLVLSSNILAPALWIWKSRSS